MSNCSDCKDSILSSQSTDISTPLCQGDCPDDVSCNGIRTYSTCVTVNVDIDCGDTVLVESGGSLNEVLQAIADTACESQAANCGVKVTANDPCCGTLESKLTSSSLLLTTSPSASCQSISIEERDWTWVNLTFLSNWELDGEAPAYGYRNAGLTGSRGEVRFRGHMKRKNDSIVSIAQVFNSTLPANVRPAEDKKYYFTSIGTSGKPFFVTITISASTGKIESYFTNMAGYPGNTSAKGLKISLDTINYIK